MKLYRFELFLFTNKPISMYEQEAVEKPKSYEIQRDYGKSRILKEEIGRLNGYGTTLYLLEPDMAKAKEIFSNNLRQIVELKRKALEKAESNYKKLQMFLPELSEPLMTEEMYDELKKNVFFAGADAMVDVLDHDLDFATDEEMMQALDNVLAQMPKEEAYKYYQKYCTNPTLGR